ncbi:viomycin phosphotransferase [Streptomyces sp. NPDC046215]|uniref:Aminoglycoside phosphotransferase domain-containing protein n=1 Tax=Streptomyces stramineus TaxID=173861 RepID=A0ABP3J8K3_9ACTN
MEILETHHTLLSRLLPGDRPDGLTVRQGQFHHVVIGTERVVCFARTGAAARRLPDRAARLRTLAGLALGFQTPEPLEEGAATSPDKTAYLVLDRIPGAPLEAESLESPEVAGAVAAQYATLLAGLAAAGGDHTVRAALPHAPGGEWRRFADGVRAELFPLMNDAGRARAGRELAALGGLPHLTSAVVHGDLGGENVLWETAGGLPRLSGVVDWDEVTLGDQAEDLAAIGASYGEELLDRVLALGDGPQDGDVAGRIATIRGTFALQQALYAQRDADKKELTDALTGYH